MAIHTLHVTCDAASTEHEKGIISKPYNSKHISIAYNHITYKSIQFEFITIASIKRYIKQTERSKAI